MRSGDGRRRREAETGGGDGRRRREAETGGGDGRRRREAETGGGDGRRRREAETGGGDGRRRREQREENRNTRRRWQKQPLSQVRRPSNAATITESVAQGSDCTVTAGAATRTDTPWVHNPLSQERETEANNTNEVIA